MRCALVAVVLAAGCSSEPPPPAPAAADAATPARAPAALRKLWRDSVRYKKKFQARARNREGYARDLKKLERMLTEVEAYKRCPVAEPAGDAVKVKALLEDYLNGFTPGAKVTVTAGAGPKTAAPAQALTTEGYHYPDDQVAGHHEVRVEIDAADVDGFRKRLGTLERLLVVEGVETSGGRAVVAGEVPYFRQLTPVRFVRPAPDVDALITQAAPGVLTGASEAKAQSVRANYAAVDAIQGDLDASLAVSAEVTVREARWRAYKAVVERFKQGQAGGAKPAKKHGH